MVNGADTEQERSECEVVAEWNTRLERIERAVWMTRRSLTEERRLLTLCREPASDKESQPQRPARERNESAGGAQRGRCFREVEGIESAAIERGVVVHIRTDGNSVGCGKWTTIVVRSPLTGKRVWLPLEAGCSNSGGLFGQAHSLTVFRRDNGAP